MKAKKPEKILKGWDWTELGRQWNLWGAKSGLSDDQMAEKIRKHFWSVYDPSKPDNKQSAECKKVVADIRKFIKLLIKASAYSAPVYKGMLEVKNLYTYLQWVDTNLEGMWS